MLYQPSNRWVPSAVATGGPGDRASLTVACAPPFRFTQITVFGTSLNDKTTHNDKKGMITFKHNSPLTFSRFLQNSWQPTAVHKSDAIFRLINMPLRMCREREM